MLTGGGFFLKVRQPRCLKQLTRWADRYHPAGYHTKAGRSLMSTPSRQLQALYQWVDVLHRRLSLTRPQAVGLALWSIGIVLAKSCSLTAVALSLATWLGWPRPNLIKRLREWYLEAGAKKGSGTQGRGRKRRDWSVEVCAPALVHWILETWPSLSVVLALD